MTDALFAEFCARGTISVKKELACPDVRRGRERGARVTLRLPTLLDDSGVDPAPQMSSHRLRGEGDPR